jgi:long-chain acyl-CoA synthetase
MKDRELIQSDPNDSSLHDGLLRGAKIANDKPFLGRRVIVNGEAGPYIWETYGQVLKRVEAVGSGMAKLGINLRECVGLFSINNPEWVMAEHACYQYNFTTVPLYDTLGDQAIEYIINQTEMRIVFATSDKIQILFKLREKIPTVSIIIATDYQIEQSKLEELRFQAGQNIRLLSFEEIEQLGREGGIKPPAGKATQDDIATICYTSGTTGNPKGVVLTHRNILSAVQASHELSRQGQLATFTSDDVYLSYLPLAHIMERKLQALFTSVGARIGFYQGSTLKLMDDAAELKPTLFVSVPRLYNRIYDKVLASVKAKGGVAAQLFNFAYKQKRQNLQRGITTHWLWDRLVFATVRNKLGGRVKLMLSGSAPISSEVIEFLRICFSATVYEGYGQTETCAVLSLTCSADFTTGHIGVPYPCCEVKLVDLPEMGYTSADQPYPRGEICVRGHQVFREYYRLPDKTAETIDADGWCHTGDVGMWDERGHLRIIDRAKNIFKLAQGEYIAPERIENVYQKHELVAQAFVYGDSLQATLVGIIVPDEEALAKFAKSHNLGDKSFKELCENEEVRKHILGQITAFGKEQGLKGFENVKNIRLESEPFSVENDLLTPSFKLKRQPAAAKYRALIDEMYAELS